MLISKTLVQAWLKDRHSIAAHDHRAGLRLGQDFFNEFRCHHVTSQPARRILDRIYELDGVQALGAIMEITDHSH